MINGTKFLQVVKLESKSCRVRNLAGSCCRRILNTARAHAMQQTCMSLAKMDAPIWLKRTWLCKFYLKGDMYKLILNLNHADDVFAL